MRGGGYNLCIMEQLGGEYRWLLVWTEVSNRLGWIWLVRLVGRFGLRFLVGLDGDGDGCYALLVGLD